jgi:RNA polymerase sigma-70 factor (ECF subfamily)
MFRVRTVEPDVDDRELARCAAQGRRAAQQNLLRRLASPIHATLYHVLGSNEHMEGLLQDVFVEIFRSLAAYDRKRDLDTWACAIALRVVCQRLRSDESDSRPIAEGPGRRDFMGPPEAEGPRAVGLEQMYALLRSLAPEQHVTLALSMMARRSVNEIAALTEADTAVVRERIHLARSLLCSAARGDSGLMASIALHPVAD